MAEQIEDLLSQLRYERKEFSQCDYSANISLEEFIRIPVTFIISKTICNYIPYGWKYWNYGGIKHEWSYLSISSLP